MSVNEIKEWIKNHKKWLIITSVSVTVGAIGGVNLYKYGRRGVEKFKNGAVDVYNTLYPAMKGSYGAYLTCNLTNNETIKDCPKLIEELLECDFVDLDEKITGLAVFRKAEK